MKRILSVVLLVAMLATLLPSMPIKAKAANRWEVINTGNVTGQDIAARAEFYIGAGRYDGSNYKERTGFGTTLHFDCSGFVYRVLRDLDLGSTQPNVNVGQLDPYGNYFEGKNSAGYYYITAHTQNQRYYGKQLSEAVSLYKRTGDYSLFQPGDLMVFSYNGGASVSHMAIYVGDGKVVHSTSSRGVYKTALSQTGWPNGKLGNSLIDANRLVTDGHNYNNQGFCPHCNTEYDYNATLSTDAAGIYSIKAALYLRETPYCNDDNKVGELLPVGTEVLVLGTVTNAFGEVMAKVSYNDIVGYHRLENLNILQYHAQEITCVLDAPQEGAVLPQATYNLSGTITSVYPLALVEGYIDGSLYTTVQLGKTTTLDIRSSNINKALSFSSLASGTHTLTLKARDIHRSEMVTICTRMFTIDGNAACNHSYTAVVTTEPTCTQAGVMTYTCTWCKDAYTEEIIGEHNYNDRGICGICNEAFDYAPSFSADRAGIYAVNTGLILRATPYYNDTKVSDLLSVNTEVVVLGTVVNAAGELWAKVSYNEIVGYHQMKYFTFLREAEQGCEHNYKSEVTDIPTCTKEGTLTYTCILCDEFYTETLGAGHCYEDGICMDCGDPEMIISCTVTQPAEGAIVQKASYNVLGTITSASPLALVEAYIDGACYASVSLGDTTTLDIRFSKINDNLKFKELPSGPHTLEIRARDIYHEEMITVSTRRFVTEGAVSCNHNYVTAVTKAPTCTQNGTMTYTCSLCQANYTVTLTARHEFVGGICTECGQVASHNLVLNADTEVDLSLTEDLYVDLAGYELTGTIQTNGFRVFGMDSTTDRYTNDRMGYFNCEDENGLSIVPQSVTTTKDMVRYMTIATDEGYTFHRFYLGITHLNLVPATTGFGYKAQFRGDEMVHSYVDSVAYDLWITESNVVSRTINGFTDKCSLRLNNVDVQHYGQTPVYARVSMTLADGTVVEGAVHASTFRDLVEAVDLQVDSLTAGQLAAVRAMIAKYPIMQTWYLDNLFSMY